MTTINLLHAKQLLQPLKGTSYKLTDSISASLQTDFIPSKAFSKAEQYFHLFCDYHLWQKFHSSALILLQSSTAFLAAFSIEISYGILLLQVFFDLLPH